MHGGRFIMKKRIIAFIKSKYSLGRDKTIRGYDKLEEKIITQANIYRTRFNALTPVKQNRTIVLILSLVLVADYLMICLHTGRNPIDIFPSIPVLDMRDEITVYVPSPEGKILKESRLVDISDDEEFYAKRLVHFVTSGSAFENTRTMTPIQGNVRKIWISEGTCVVDFWLETLDDDAPFTSGAENLYHEAITKTLTENIKSIKKVIICENGIPGKNIWDTSVTQLSQTPEKTSQAGPVIKM